MLKLDMSTPSISILPVNSPGIEWGIRPERHKASVDLPDPVGPVSSTKLPLGMEISAERSTLAESVYENSRLSASSKE
jgi:hypothetical protein